MRNNDGSREPMLGDRRTSPGCGCLFMVIFFGLAGIIMGGVNWFHHWIGG